MASCITSQWATGAPQAKLEVTQSASTGGASTLSWKLYYVAKYAAQAASADRDYNVYINGTKIKTGSFNINGKTGTLLVASGTRNISKTTSAQSISFKVEFEFKLTWSGTYGGWKSASNSISIPAKSRYIVTYEANGGTNAPASQTKWYGATLTLTTSKPTKSGSTFLKWNTNAKGTGINYSSGGSYTANENAVLYAIWSSNTYTITYNANGGSGAPASQTKTHGVNLTLRTGQPTRTGYTFKGWALTNGGSVYYQPGGTCGKNQNLTLYAVWEANTYTITYNANGGSGAPASQKKTYGKNLTLSTAKPTRTNYTFLRWNTNASGTGTSYNSGGTYSVNAAATLYAVWSSNYTKPRITNRKVYRSNSSGTADEEGTYARVEFSWACDYTVSSIKVEWKLVSAASYSTTNAATVSASGTSGDSAITIGANALSKDSTYNVRITVTDSGGSTSSTILLSGTKYIIDVRAQGKGLAFGKPAEIDNYVDFGQDAIFNNLLVIYGRNTNGALMQTFQPLNGNNNTIVGYGHYAESSGNTHIYGHDINFGVSNTGGNKVFYKPYYSKGDSWTLILSTAGYLTDAKREVNFQVPLSKPVIGSPTVTVTSNGGLKLRQNENYTHGSAANTFASPSSYRAVLNNEGSISVTADFEDKDLTNAVNNSAIGVYWSGKITLE